MLLYTCDIFRVTENWILVLLLFPRVENTNFVPEAGQGAMKELEVGLDSVHRYDEVVAIWSGYDVFQTDESFPLLWFSDDSTEVLHGNVFRTGPLKGCVGYHFCDVGVGV